MRARIQLDSLNRLSCQGRWTADAMAGLSSPQILMRLFTGKSVDLDTSGIDALDTAGACQLKRIIGVSPWLAFGDISKGFRTYLAYMEESVAGLYVDAPVRYQGVEVGRIRC